MTVGLRELVALFDGVLAGTSTRADLDAALAAASPEDVDALDRLATLDLEARR